MFRMSIHLAGCWAWFAVLSSSVVAQWDTVSIAGLKARSIGPAGMSGRISDIDALADDPNLIIVGTATGGVWKSLNGGITWKPIFDRQPVSSIGAVAIDPSNPSLIWVGTGEAHTRNTAGVGNGVYKSPDGGETWKYLGLDKTEKIHNVIVHPHNPDVVYVSALGSSWAENPERGVFKTTDGGKTWKRILFVDSRTGCADLVMDPGNPNKLFAAMWEHRRWPWFFKSGGSGSGLYVTHDGGENWKRLTDKEGLPSGDLGRIGLAISRSNPEVVYALVEAQKSLLLRSEDGGRSWKRTNDKPNISARPFYFSDIRVDPQDENRLYLLHYIVELSIDRGKTFETVVSWDKIHGDHHALWISPKDGRIMINGNDGGLAITQDRGKTWRFVENLPLAQFYHIAVDMNTPYRVYGGLQDNGSWRGPGSVWEWNGIRNYHWEPVGWGDGFGTLPDPQNPSIVYSMSQGGYLYRYNDRNSELKIIRPPQPDGVKLRFNWNAAIALDPFDSGTVYYGSQFVHKSTDRGETWTIVSPDLTTNDTSKQHQAKSGGLTLDVTSAENYCTILTIAPSPVKRGVIWVGTDDGQVHVTRDGGGSWENVVQRIPKLPGNTWCPHIEASPFEEGTAFAVFDDHRRNNWTTYAYRTTDFGKTWTSLTTRPPRAEPGDTLIWGYALSIAQDPVDRDVLFLGTGFGLFFSLDGGKAWKKFTAGFPTVPVTEIVVHPRDHDLVVGTHGRAVYIIDRIGVLRQLKKNVLDQPLHAFEIPTAVQYQGKAGNGYFGPGDAFFSGDNVSYGAMITYYMQSARVADTSKGSDSVSSSGAQKKVRIEISNSEGKTVRKMEGPVQNGINRVYWDLLEDPFKTPKLGQRGGEGEGQGPEILPGTYTVKIQAGRHEVFQKVEVVQDPRYTYDATARKEKYEVIRKIGERIEIITEAVERIQKMNKVIQDVLDRAREPKDSLTKNLAQSGETLQKTLRRVQDLLVESPDVQGINDASDVALTRLQTVQWFMGSSWDAPSIGHMNYLRQADSVLAKALHEFNRVFAEDVVAFENKVKEASFNFFPEKDPLDLDWRRKKE